eukprot:g11471.t1
MLFFPLLLARVASLILAARFNNGKLLELIEDGYRLDKLRAAASNERFRITLLVRTDLDVNPNHKLPRHVDNRAGRKKGRLQTKRRKSNGEFSTTSRVFTPHQATSNAKRAAAPVSAALAAAATAHANAVASLSQGQGAGDAWTDKMGLGSPLVVRSLNDVDGAWWRRY